MHDATHSIMHKKIIITQYSPVNLNSWRTSPSRNWRKCATTAHCRPYSFPITTNLLSIFLVFIKKNFSVILFSCYFIHEFMLYHITLVFFFSHTLCTINTALFSVDANLYYVMKCAEKNTIFTWLKNTKKIIQCLFSLDFLWYSLCIFVYSLIST